MPVAATIPAPLHAWMTDSLRRARRRSPTRVCRLAASEAEKGFAIIFSLGNAAKRPRVELCRLPVTKFRLGQK